MQKTKKQHYVPQSYLKAWAIPGTYQVHVYDKKTDNEDVFSQVMEILLCLKK